ncbi:unnamed protein product [Auanema sp. JU1783]|nr:unnamed protein product [Auanema sp. JU1783]
MGLGRDLDDSRPLKIVTFSDVEEDLSSENDLVENLLEQTDEVDRKAAHIRRRYRRNPFLVSLTPKVPKSRSSGKKKKRYNETIEMINATIDDLCLDCSDIMQETHTPFRRLFSNPRNMKAWRSFVEVEKREQNSMTENNEFLILDMSLLSLEDDHDRYNKINDIFDELLPCQRSLLFQCETILNSMESLEQELRACFVASPTASSIYLFKSELERVTCNVISQYLGLSSENYKQGKKVITEVSNGAKTFACPDTTMAVVLSDSSKFSGRTKSNFLGKNLKE